MPVWQGAVGRLGYRNRIGDPPVRRQLWKRMAGPTGSGPLESREQTSVPSDHVDVVPDDPGGVIHADGACVYGEVVVGCRAPYAAGVPAVVLRSLPVLVLDVLVGLLLGEPVPPGGALYAVGYRSGDEDVHHIPPLPQHIVGTSADEHARSLRRYVEYRLRLGLEQRVGRRDPPVADHR